MSGETLVTVIGNLTAAPELRFTPAGVAVSNLTIASTPRLFDKNANEWKDGDTLFLRGSIWREAAEQVAESLSQGARVIAQGYLKQRSYEKDGVKHTVIEMEILEIGPSLKYAKATVTKISKNSGGGGIQGASNQSRSNGASAGNEDPWGTDTPPF